MTRSLLAAALLALATAVQAATPTEEARDRLADLLRQRTGGQAEIVSFKPAALDGLYEVVLTRGEGKLTVSYFAPARDLFFSGGDLWDLRRGESLTAPALQAAQAARLKPLVARLPLELAVRMGAGPHVVIEVTDPDCGFCRRIEPFFKGRTDVTRYVFIAPLAHPQAARKVSYILQASDPAKALEKAMAGGLDDPQALEGFKPLPAIEGLAQRHLEVARSLGVDGTPWFFVDGEVAVSGADEAALAKALEAPARDARPAKDARPPAKAGAILYPKEIEGCEPCKRLWLANNKKRLEEKEAKEAADAGKAP